MLFLHNALQQEGNINMTHQQGGGIPHAWLLTKHEMFMLSVYGLCMGVWICVLGKNMGQSWLWSTCGASHCFIYSCITVWQAGRLPSPDQRYGYWTGQDINISPAPFLPLLFLTLSLLYFDMVLAFPRAVALSECAGGSATSWRHSQIAMEDRAK